jgi:hypothetical protein
MRNYSAYHIDEAVGLPAVETAAVPGLDGGAINRCEITGLGRGGYAAGAKVRLRASQVSL